MCAAPREADLPVFPTDTNVPLSVSCEYRIYTLRRRSREAYNPGPMKNPASRILPPQRILLGPGPSDVPASVLEALGAPTIGHLDPAYLAIMDETREMLRTLFRTRNAMT